VARPERDDNVFGWVEDGHGASGLLRATRRMNLNSQRRQFVLGAAA
jgi:hypothetical protein